jgi:hypothetical protein
MRNIFLDKLRFYLDSKAGNLVGCREYLMAGVHVLTLIPESRGQAGRSPGYRPCTFWFSLSAGTIRYPARRSLLLITVQRLFSAIHCKCLYSIANNMVCSYMLSSRNARVSNITGQTSPGSLSRTTHTHIAPAPVDRMSVATCSTKRKHASARSNLWACTSGIVKAGNKLC